LQKIGLHAELHQLIPLDYTPAVTNSDTPSRYCVPGPACRGRCNLKLWTVAIRRPAARGSRPHSAPVDRMPYDCKAVSSFHVEHLASSALLDQRHVGFQLLRGTLVRQVHGPTGFGGHVRGHRQPDDFQAIVPVQ